jgi:hypothetical protein
MSYLDPLRLHFAGRFLAAPSTVNNDPAHFDNAMFLPRYRQYGPGATDGWWNPRGNADFRLIGCRVTAAWSGGQPVTADPILECLVADSNTRVAAKLVDLDSEQQMVSEIWGLEVRIATAGGATLVGGRFAPAAFADIWTRFPTGRPDSFFGAMYQSTLVDLEWTDVSGSPFLTALKQAAPGGRLSIKFNVDGFDDDVTSPTFTQGRVVGTIGPATDNEPTHLVLGRHFLPTPQNPLNACVARVDAAAETIYVDVGNALPTTSPGGPLQNLGALTLACVFPNDANNNTVVPLALGTIPYLTNDWYAKTAGVVAVPVSGSALRTAQSNALGLLLTTTGAPVDGVTEPIGGLFARADQFVYRLEPGETAQVTLYATAYGQPLAGATVINVADPSQLQGQAVSHTGVAPPVAVPAQAISFPCRVTTDARGIAMLPIAAADPGNPRGYIDGQVYGVRPMLQDTVLPSAGYPFNGTDFISLLVWNAFDAKATPTWQTLQPIFQQYANLYPVMDAFLDLGDYDSICRCRTLLLLAFGLPVTDPNSMPVTRDLSPSKRAAILRWLTEVGPDGKPLAGEGPPAAAVVRAKAAPAAGAGPGGPPPTAMRGGKGAALARRLQRTRTPWPRGQS